MENKKRRRRTGKKARRNRIIVILSGVLAAFAIVLVGAMIGWLIIGDNKTPEEEALEQEALFEASLEVEEEKNEEFINESTIDAIVKAGHNVSEALSKRPATVEMTPENTAEFATIESCSINESGKVEVSVKSEGIPKSDDKYYYLFEEATYDEGIVEGSEPIARIYKNDDTSFSVDLNKGAANTRLFSKFQVAVKMDDQYVSISHAKYITNPGACAGYSYGGMQHKSIKGLLPDPLRIGELADLGCEYATYNIPLNHILVTSGGIPYSYGGVTITSIRR